MFCPGVLIQAMPAKRDPSQTVITISLSKRLLGKVDDVCQRILRGAPRAQLMRDALQDYLKSKHHVDVEDVDVIPPARTFSHSVNEEVSKPAAEQRREVKYEKPKRKRKP